jgi:hypothetical protein
MPDLITVPRSEIKRLLDYLYNPFEPNNQSKHWHAWTAIAAAPAVAAEPAAWGSGDGLGAVLTYTSNGRSGVHGMTMGADSSGNFAVLFMGNAVDAENAATEYLRRLQQAGYRISAAHIVPNVPLFSGTAIRVVDAPLP